MSEVEFNKPIEMDDEYLTLKSQIETSKVPKEEEEHITVAATPVDHPKNYVMGKVSVSPPDMIITFNDIEYRGDVKTVREKNVALPLNDLKRVIRYLYEN